MSQILFIVLLILALVAFIIYLFGTSFAGRIKEKGHSPTQARPGDLGEMVKLLETGGYNNAKLVIDQLSARKLTTRDAEDILALRMRAFFKMKEYHNALHSALQLVQYGGKSRFITEMELIEHLAEIYSALGHNEKAYNEYLLLSQRSPKNIEYLYNAAAQALELSQYETAISLFERVLQQRSDHYPSLSKLGRIYFEKALYSQALDYFNRAYSGKYDSNELRYYLALTLLKTSGKDTVALSLLQRVSHSSSWAKRALPHLARLWAKLNEHGKVIAAVGEYCKDFGQDNSNDLLYELKMLQANAHRQIHELDKACQLWREISPESFFYREATEQWESFQDFTQKEGVFHDYLHLKNQEFVNLCAKIFDSMLSQEKLSVQNFVVEHAPLAVLFTDNEEPVYKPMGALILQHFQERWDPSRGRQNRPATNFHIYLRLDQPFTDADLAYNLKKHGANYACGIEVHIYAFHYVSPSIFSHNVNYNVHVHASSELQGLMRVLGSAALPAETVSEKGEALAFDIREVASDPPDNAGKQTSALENSQAADLIDQRGAQMAGKQADEADDLSRSSETGKRGQAGE
ncbi:MAG: hypothetical protein AAF975_05125 [Spirochaetota bacterium]